MKNPKSQTTAIAGPMISIAGSEIDGFEVRGIRAAVVYGDKSRLVLHIHHAVTLGKNEQPSDKEVKARALKLAASEFERRGIEVGEGLRALAVDPAALLAGVEYQVDESGRKLVPVSPRRGRRAQTPGKTSAAAKRRSGKT